MTLMQRVAVAVVVAVVFAVVVVEAARPTTTSVVKPLPSFSATQSAISTGFFTFDLAPPLLSRPLTGIRTRYTYAKAQRDAFSFLRFPTKSKQLPVVCLHGFGGNADQWRKNVPVLAANGHDTYALDLLGYGYSDKPNPKEYAVNEVYNFENWAYQTTSFVERTVREPCVLVSNSVGGVAALEAARTRPDLVKGVVLIDISLRLLHVKKQNPLTRPLVSVLQTVLRETPVGKAFFKSVATPDTLRNILQQAYAGPVDDDTVQCILQPGLQPGAADVFLDFISYSGGPLPEELLPQMQVPVRILWGDNDPWEPIDMGRKYGEYPAVDEFVALPGGGHCPMDKVPDLVNKEVLRFLSKF
jgi:pimeloyl-ACP methyl ester carboxylesterase